ncbi:keratin, type I cytoskeletal 19-like [Carettochelys insculpta]|uniref:keratin, type I cytoskeletal 19-like n=1 Tax=Carettochelys insculpta TaxID=44489 RepID=UPI003EBA466E
MSYRSKTTVTSSTIARSGSGGRSSSGAVGGGGQSSGSAKKGVSTGISSAGNFSCRSYGGGGSICGYGGSNRITAGGCYGGAINSGSCGVGYGSSCGSFGRGVTYGGGFGGGAVCGSGFGGGIVCGGGRGGGSFGVSDACILGSNDKVTMQGLNDRLSAYLDQVRLLEEKNANLERSIKEWYETQGPGAVVKDYSHYFKILDDLEKETADANLELNTTAVELDNTKMTIEDFQLKYQTELSLRQNVEADINGLRPLLDQLTLAKSDLEMEYESLKEELITMKKNHEEEVKALLHQATGEVNVEVNACPSTDLTEKLNEMRRNYDYVIESNRKELEKWYECKIAEVNQEVSASGQEIETSNKQITDLRRAYQDLEIELQSLHSMIQSLQSSLEDTEGRYNMQLQQIQCLIGSVEEELANVRCEIENQSQEYTLLLGIKDRLEQEIAQYHNLLEKGNQEIPVGGNVGVSSTVRGGPVTGGGGRPVSSGTSSRGGEGGGSSGSRGGARDGGASGGSGGGTREGSRPSGGGTEEKGPAYFTSYSAKPAESYMYSRNVYE